MNTGRNEYLHGTTTYRTGNSGAAVRNLSLITALLFVGGCTRADMSGSAASPPTFPNPQILQFRILASPERDAAVCERAKARQARETALGRPWSAEVYRDAEGQQDLSARWYRCDPEFVQWAMGSRDMLVRKLPGSAGPVGQPNAFGAVAQHEVLALADNFNINRVDFESIRTDLDDSGAPCVRFAMTKSGAGKLFNLTSMRLPTPDGNFSTLAIIFDDRVISAPRLNEAISSHGQITGRFTLDEVNRLVEMCNVTHIVKPRPMPGPASVGTGFATPTSPRPLPTPLGTGVSRPVPVFNFNPTGTPTGTPVAKPTGSPTGTPTAKPSGTSAGSPTATPSSTEAKRP